LGGTGQTSAGSSGQALVSNGTNYAPADVVNTLTAGSGIAITGSSGNYTIAQSGSGTVLSVTGSNIGVSPTTGNVVVTLSGSNVTSALGYTPPSLSGTNSFTGANSFSGATTHSGVVAIGTSPSSIYNLNVAGQAAQPAGVFSSSSSSGSVGILVNMLGNPTAVDFQYNGTTVGAIQVTNSSTTYVTSSDRRLKDNIVPLANSGTEIDALQPRQFTWKSTGQAAKGFIADELQQIIPDAVSGTANAVDAEGNPVYQGIDASTPEMIALLVAEVQSLRLRVAALEAK
jgi:hypothetical protein